MVLKTYVGDHHHQWDQWLPEFRFAINSAWQESTDFTPAQGRSLKGPLERAIPTPQSLTNKHELLERQQELMERARENVKSAQRKQKRFYDLKRKVQEFKEGDFVWVKTPPLYRSYYSGVNSSSKQGSM